MCKLRSLILVMLLATILLPVDANPLAAKPWNSDYSINHPRFCRDQGLRYEKVAGYLMAYIYDRNISHVRYGRIDDKTTQKWKWKITAIGLHVADNVLKLRGRDCGVLANQAIKKLNLIHKEVKQYPKPEWWYKIPGNDKFLLNYPE